MTTDTDICNMALGWVGTRSSIVSLTENSNEARVCSRFYDQARTDVLQTFWWGFAGAQRRLSLLGQAIDQTALLPWAFKYAYPADCAQARFILLNNSGSTPPQFFLRDSRLAAIPYEISSDFDSSGNVIKVISSNYPNAVMSYTRDITAVNMFDTQFVSAVARLLSSYIAIPLSGSVAIAEQQRKIAMDLITEAASNSGNEGLTIHDPQVNWIDARGINFYCNNGLSMMPGGFLV